ncbi:hypothetical protein F441_18132 [Phytophthora nicotianae CJ01A1]|uniref:Uncharacterized protein n=3 Tax=Phytophthora nicotianae TaxID=4792 RepID=W2MGS9_PHYNI|nr:hypothetical protein L916_17687 [Phytophthora nicotianae]ETL82305.1 hypothetical protein L917_17518 [Phytophthora nicotianae]ETM35520.1 hypothetical protein L914_17599 [Phytophthora nicotianae]ETO64137.1 hypothetical protein F444_18285 [Phytophthora nicotianae P1976]ETP05228.1 hypothetical protein F441_18132 [Phytophthora nicotianae CJ01A1]
MILGLGPLATKQHRLRGEIISMDVVSLGSCA